MFAFYLCADPTILNPLILRLFLGTAKIPMLMSVMYRGKRVSDKMLPPAPLSEQTRGVHKHLEGRFRPDLRQCVL